MTIYLFGRKYWKIHNLLIPEDTGIDKKEKKSQKLYLTENKISIVN